MRRRQDHEPRLQRRALAQLALRSFFATGFDTLIAAYPENALKRISRAQHFSYWMTTILHIAPYTTDFDWLRGLGELCYVTHPRHAQEYLAKRCTGWDYVVDDWR